MLKKEKLEQLLALCMDSQADFAEIYEELEHTETIRMLDGKVEDIDRKVVNGIGIRLYKDLQSVYAFANKSDDATVLPLIEDLKDAVGHTSDSEEKKESSIVLTPVTYDKIHTVKVDYEKTPLFEKADLLARADKAAKEVDERIVKVQGVLLNVKQQVQISNSEGRLVDDTRVRTRMMITAYAKEGDNMQSGGDRPGAGMGLEYFETKTPEETGREAARVALVNLKAQDCPSGKMPVIIDNEFGGVIFHEACGHGLEATSVAKNFSIFAGKVGQQIAASCVNAMDDGTIPGAWGSEHVDDEGNPQQKRQLIKDGILQGYMIDRLNGRRMGAESTGSGRRESYKYEPTSRMSNTFIMQGTSKFEELFEGIERGLYAKKMGGGSVNPQTGDFNFAVNEGYLIENGKITVPVKGAALIGNGGEILWNIDRVCENLERAQGMCGSASGSIPTDVGQPAIRVSSITVGGTASE